MALVSAVAFVQAGYYCTKQTALLLGVKSSEVAGTVSRQLGYFYLPLDFNQILCKWKILRTNDIR